MRLPPAFLYVFLLGCTGCTEPELPPPRPVARPDSRSADPGHLLLASVRTVVRECRPPATGELSACAPALVRPLEAAESRLGPVPALRAYCHALSSADPITRAVIAVRMGTQSHYRALAEQPDAALHGCLLKELRSAQEATLARRIARPAAFLATALRKEGELLSTLEKAPAEVRAVAHECLWPNGRLRVLDALTRAAASPARELRLAAVMGFAYDRGLQAEERTVVCPLLARLLEDLDPVVAGSAAARLATLCPDLTGTLLKAAERQLSEKRTSAELVAALQLLSGTAAEAQRARTLLARIAASPAPCQACPQALAKQAAARTPGPR